MLKKILVTGGLGYVGSHIVVRLIENGYTPIIVDNLSKSNINILDMIEKISGTRPKIYILDCAENRDLLNNVFKEHPDIYAVIHLAAYRDSIESIEHPFTYYKNNCLSIYNVTDLAALNGIRRIIFSSTSKVYDVDTTQMPLSEDSPLKINNNPYVNSKVMCCQMLHDFSVAHNLKSIILRYFNPIGSHKSGLLEYQPMFSRNKVLTNIMDAAYNNIVFNIYGRDYTTKDGTTLRDFIDVNDLADAHIAALKKIDDVETTSIFNIGRGKPASILSMLNKFMAYTDTRVRYEFADRRPNDAERIYSNVSLANNILNWKAATPISESIVTAWNSFKNKKSLTH